MTPYRLVNSYLMPYAPIFVVYVVTVQASSSKTSVTVPIEKASYIKRLESDQHRFERLKSRVIFSSLKCVI